MVSCRGLLSHRCLVDMSCEQVLCAKRRVCSQDRSTREGGLLLTSLVNTVGLPMFEFARVCACDGECSCMFYLFVL